MSKNYQKSFPSVKNAGFTLIELLVVVLIIGILAAVALPQYERAVQKARLAKVLPLVTALAKAEENYWLANNQYTPYAEDLDVSLPPGLKSVGTQEDTGFMYLDEKTTIDLLGGTEYIKNIGSTSARIRVSFENGIGYSHYLDRSCCPNQRWCCGEESFCKSLGAQTKVNDCWVLP